MARRKNTKRIDPRYFLNETTYRGLSENQQAQALLQRLRDPKSPDGSPGLGDQNYWQQKVQSNLFSEGLGGSKPKRQIGGESFSRIFGGNTGDIRPQGAAELTFSGNFDKTENPNLTQNQQRNGSFIFDQSI